ncbi:MAG TPA: SH3 domain-containing protein, partial [Candidatus Peribacteria bacterium]|nr:SH3 domain-containing protein [Candidatus Peribacteria bacterium]
EKTFEEFTFTDSDLQKVYEIADGSSSSSTVTLSVGSGAMAGSTPSVGVAMGSGLTMVPATSSSAGTVAAADPAKVKLYEALRLGAADQAANIYKVNNPFLNVRSSMEVSSPQIDRLTQGEVLIVLEIPNAEWAKVRLADQREGYVAMKYIAKLTTDVKLAEEKKQFEGKYFVDFAFLNMRKDPSSQSEKIAEIPGQAILTPLSMNGEWARVSYGGKEGYVSSQYLKPFQPTFLVRQDEYTLPILQYRAGDAASMASFPKHMAALKAAGKKVVTLKSLYDLIIAQESRDARVGPDWVVVTVAGVNAQNVKAVSDALEAANVSETLFIGTKDVGITGITEKTILNLMANGNDLQSEAHAGDDLRSLTDSQVMLELGQSKKILEDVTKREVYAVSYPMGGVNDRVMKKAADLGYLFGISQSPDKKFTRGQFLRLPSLFVSSTATPDEVVRLVK